MKSGSYPSVRLGGVDLVYADSFNNLGYTVTANFDDDDDIKKEMPILFTPINTLIRIFKFLSGRFYV